MLLHDNVDGLHNEPIQTLQSFDNVSNTPLDWYGAQASQGDPTDGVARTLVNEQLTDPSAPIPCCSNTTFQFGSWTGHNYTGQQFYFETAWAVTMLNKTVVQAPPKAVFSISPNPSIANAEISLDGSASSDQNPNGQIVSWTWSYGPANNTTPLGTGVKLNVVAGFPCSTPPCSVPINLTVADNLGLTGSVTNILTINGPQASAPTANAAGPYSFCPNVDAKNNLIYAPWILNGSLSKNPDQGKFLKAGDPPSTIVDYEWSFDLVNYNHPGTGNNTSSQLTVLPAGPPPASFPAPFTPSASVNSPTSFLVGLKVTNNDNLAFEDLSAGCGPSFTTQTCSTATATVSVHNAADDACTHCVKTLGANVKNPTPGVAGNIQLYWTDTNTSAFAIDHYNVYRSTSATFSPFSQIAGANSIYALPAVKVPTPSGGTVYFQDTHVSASTTYYYRVAPATLNDSETCAGNLTLKATLGAGR